MADYAYDAWGKVLSVTGTMASALGQLNPLRYRGYVYDYETQLYYLQSRYYDPVIGRFINADGLVSTGQGIIGNNMFAYCGNNPVSRNDDGGEFWHIVVGAVAGAAISALATGIVSYVEHGAVDWAAVGISAISGAASGALSATGLGVGVMIAGNAAISMAENATNQVIKNGGFNNFDGADLLIDGAFGAVSGAIGGAGKGSKHLTNLGIQTVKRTFNTTVNKGLKAGIKEAGKAFVYYGKNTSKYYINFFKGLLVDAVSGIGEASATSDYMKFRYRRLMG